MRVYLAPGASGNLAWLDPWAAGLTGHGYAVTLLGLPRGRAEAAVGAYRRSVPDVAGAVIGGQSFGGRVASLLAAEVAPAGLVCLSYPLHPPGRPTEWERRTGHWPEIDCPVLLLSGESDPFARIDLLREAVGQLSRVTLVTYPRIGHGLNRVRGEALGAIIGWMERLDR